jgi:thiol-disulfide isomerase/thioredoxin
MTQWNVMTRILLLSVAAIGGLGCDRTVPPRQQLQDPQDSASSLEDAPPKSFDPESSVVPLVSSTQVADSAPGNQLDRSTSRPELTTEEQSAADDTAPRGQEWALAIRPVQSSDPTQMVRHLADIETEIQNLVVKARRMDEDDAQRGAVQLSQMKLNAAEHLEGLPDASPDQRKIARKSRLVALSHLSGLKDVRAAKQLSDFARKLLSDEDPELRHQAAIVLFGFQIQELQNGILDDPSALVNSAQQLVADPSYRSRLEMTSLAHAINVLYQMGFSSNASEMEQLAFDAFSSSPDRELRNEAWNQLTRTSQSVANFVNSLQSLGPLPADAGLVMAAARDLVQQHPNPVTLEMITGVITDLEYGGQLPLSLELTELVDRELEKHPSGVSTQAVTAALSEHRQRVGWVGRTLGREVLGNLRLIDNDGTPLDPSTLEGNVVLIDFWATWCLPCIQEIPFLRRAHQELSEKGFRVLSINMDKDPARLNQFLQNNRLPWKTYRVESGDLKMLTEKFGITLFPHTILVQRDGTVASLHVRGDRLTVEAERLLSQ